MVSADYLPENKIYKINFIKNKVDCFTFCYKKNNIFYILKNNKPLRFKPLHIEHAGNLAIVKYFLKAYNTFYLSENKKYYSMEFFNSLTTLRFFKIKYEDFLTLQSKGKILKKWKVYMSKYLPRKTIARFLRELQKCNNVSVILSFWPIELKNKHKIWEFTGEIRFRYFENLKYYNFFGIKEILTANFEEPNDLLMSLLIAEWGKLINKKTQEAYSVLDREYKEAIENNDDISKAEIDIVKKTIATEVTEINYNVFKTPNALFRFWPNILYPGPDPVKF